MASLAAPGDETDVMFEALFGEQIKAVKATRERDDDLKLAEDMILTVRNTEISPALTVRLCEQAYALAASVPTGTKVSLSAMRLLAEKVTTARPEARRKMNQLLVRAHNAAKGDDRKRMAATIVSECEAEGDMLGRARHWRAAAEQYALAGRYASERGARERLKGKLALAEVNARVADELVRQMKLVKSNPRHRSARERIMEIHLTYNDSPAEAAKWLSDDCSEAYRRHVPLAAGKLTALTPEDCAALATWYGHLLDRTGQVARAALLVRARRYVRMFLAAEDVDAASRAKAAKALAQIESALKRAGRADLITDENVPTPRAPGAEPDDPSGRETARAGRLHFRGPGKGMVFTTGYGRSFAKRVRVRGDATVGPNGVMILNGGAVLTSDGPTLYKACKRTSELTVAASITPDNVTQDGPARIVTFSSTADSRNFTLGQEGRSLIFRLRTSGNGRNGSNHQPTLCTLKSDKPHRVVVTYARDVVNGYLDGRHVMRTDKVRGDFRTWDSTQTLMFGDERDTRRIWRGIIHSVRIYSRALSAEEAVKLSAPR